MYLKTYFFQKLRNAPGTYFLSICKSLRLFRKDAAFKKSKNQFALLKATEKTFTFLKLNMNMSEVITEFSYLGFE